MLALCCFCCRCETQTLVFTGPDYLLLLLCLETTRVAWHQLVLSVWKQRSYKRVLICMRCKKRDPKLLGRTKQKPNKNQREPKNRRDRGPGGSLSVRSQTVGVRVEVLALDRGSGLRRFEVDWSKVEVRRLGLKGSGTTDHRAGGPETSTRTYWSGLEVRKL